MKNSKLILVVILMIFSGINMNAQKKRSTTLSRPGPLEMPKDTETQVMSGEEKFIDMLNRINEVVTLEFDASHKKMDIYILEKGKKKLMYKGKFDETGVDTKLKAGIYNFKIYSLDGKTLLFTYETEATVTSLIKMIYHSPEKKSVILDFSKIYGSDEYTIGKMETFRYFPVFLYHTYYNTQQ